VSVGDYYRTNGDSKAVLQVEAAVDDEWHSTLEVADRASRSAKWVRLVLVYLFEEGRVERGQEDLERPFFGQTWKWVWRKPTRPRFQPLPGEPRLEP
jgi:hypothetical protein